MRVLRALSVLGPAPGLRTASPAAVTPLFELCPAPALRLTITLIGTGDFHFYTDRYLVSDELLLEDLAMI